MIHYMSMVKQDEPYLNYGVPGDKVEYKMIHYMSMVKQDEPYLNYNLKHKQGDYITGTFQVKDLPNANPKSNVIPKGKYLNSAWR